MPTEIDFLFYTEQYGGHLLTPEEFCRLLPRALAYLGNITLGRALLEQTFERELSLAACAGAEALLREEEEGHVVSETVGKYAVSYGKHSPATALFEAVELYLSATGLLYRGI